MIGDGTAAEVDVFVQHLTNIVFVLRQKSWESAHAHRQHQQCHYDAHASQHADDCPLRGG
jgi:hypothetical protein